MIWDVETGQLVQRFGNVVERTYDLEFSQDGSVIVAASSTPGVLGEVRSFDPVNGVMLKEMVRMEDCALGQA